MSVHDSTEENKTAQLINLHLPSKNGKHLLLNKNTFPSFGYFQRKIR
jgi:hypothetical protein